MKHNSNLDVYGTLKVRGVVVDDLTTQGGFYSQQFGETAYKSDLSLIAGGSIEVAQGPNSYPATDQLNFNTTYFYLTRDTTSGDPVVNWDLGEGFKEREILLSGNSKNIFWDWALGNSFFLPLQKNTTLHEPNNYKTAGAQQVNLVTQQPSRGFYNITFGRNFIFSGGVAEDSTTTAEAGAMDLYSFHFSPRSRRIFVTQASQMFY